ncbi:MAG: hypothetical protein JSW58_05140 [Candidatus Latescibacterota bacterium]|nr:MAG: hypothetical protein JSW58_05140 [Candidatus Latescibacterota bacterium]
MKKIAIIVVLGIALAIGSVVFGTNDDRNSNRDAEAILRIHKELLDAHKNHDVDRLLAPESDQIIVVSRGEVTYQTKKERVPVFEQYLKSTEFEEYRDLIQPIVRVSKDGTLGWLIAQVEIAGSRTNSDDESLRIDSVWAWIELYEKKDGRWYRVGEVSNAKPNSP